MIAAFPSPGVVLHTDSVDERQQGAYEGMALRDYFAAKAMAAVLSAADWADPLCTVQSIARDSYAMADWMLAERAK